MGEIVEFASNGSSAEGYLAVPDGGTGPGIIVIQEWWGLVPHIREVCERFAAEGFVALAPDLYHGETTEEPDEAGKMMMALNIERATRDIGGALDYLDGLESVSSTGIGVTGFCMGGGLALATAAARPDLVQAAVPFYGVIPWEALRPDYEPMTAAVSGHFAENDDFFGPELARGLEQQLRDLGKDATITIHDGCEHAFFNDTRPDVYDADHSAAAWAETVAFFRERVS